MGSLSVAVSSGAEAEWFNDAFYRFLEMNCSGVRQFEERCSMMQTIPLGASEEKLVTLWSDEALQEFLIFWRARRAKKTRAPALGPLRP